MRISRVVRSEMKSVISSAIMIVRVTTSVTSVVLLIVILLVCERRRRRRRRRSRVAIRAIRADRKRSGHGRRLLGIRVRMHIVGAVIVAAAVAVMVVMMISIIVWTTVHRLLDVRR